MIFEIIDQGMNTLRKAFLIIGGLVGVVIGMMLAGPIGLIVGAAAGVALGWLVYFFLPGLNT